MKIKKTEVYPGSHGVKENILRGHVIKVIEGHGIYVKFNSLPQFVLNRIVDLDFVSE